MTPDDLVRRCSVQNVSELIQHLSIIDADAMSKLIPVVYEYDEAAHNEGWHIKDFDGTQIAVKGDDEYYWNPLTECSYDADDFETYALIDDYENKIKEFEWDEDWEMLCDKEDITANQQEIYEYYIIDDPMLKRLEDKGEAVFDYHGLTIWGRTTTGQMLSMDSVVKEIAREMTEEGYID